MERGELLNSAQPGYKPEVGSDSWLRIGGYRKRY